MAEEVQIAQSGSHAKVRNPLGVLGLGLITLGIYIIFWWYFINREMRDLGQAHQVDLGDSPGKSVLAITLGVFIIVPPFVSYWTTCDRIAKSQGVAGLAERASGPVMFILLLVIGPVGIWYMQRELNKVWQTSTAPSGLAGSPEAPAPA